MQRNQYHEQWQPFQSMECGQAQLCHRVKKMCVTDAVLRSVLSAMRFRWVGRDRDGDGDRVCPMQKGTALKPSLCFFSHSATIDAQSLSFSRHVPCLPSRLAFADRPLLCRRHCKRVDSYGRLTAIISSVCTSHLDSVFSPSPCTSHTTALDGFSEPPTGR